MQATGVSVATANAKRGGIAYNLNVTKKVFAFGLVDLESDQFQELDLRFAPAGGAGYHIIAADTTMLDLQAGASLDREFFSTGLNRTLGEGLLGQVLMHKFNKISTLQESLFFFPGSVSRINFDASMNTTIRKWLGWQISVSDRYLSAPVPGRKKNDVIFTTGARLTFAK